MQNHEIEYQTRIDAHHKNQLSTDIYSNVSVFLWFYFPSLRSNVQNKPVNNRIVFLFSNNNWTVQTVIVMLWGWGSAAACTRNHSWYIDDGDDDDDDHKNKYKLNWLDKREKHLQHEIN